MNTFRRGVAVLHSGFLCAVTASALAAAALPEPITVDFGPTGIRSLRYRGHDYIAQGQLEAGGVRWEKKDGEGKDSPGQCARLGEAGTFSCRYPWGSVEVTYKVEPSRLGMNIVIHNNTSTTLRALTVTPLVLAFSGKPREFDGVTPMLSDNVGTVTALPITTGEATVVLTNDDVTQPLLAGFPWALDKPADTRFPLRLTTGREPMYPDSLPEIVRPIRPGGVDRYELSLRFGPPSTSARSLAADVYAAFSRRFPARLRWPDRRPIGSLMLATAATNWATNPRGWLLDRTIDVTTPAGVAQFGRRLLAWADGSVAILKKMGAQGMITWDIEGEQFPHPVTYAGDPRLVEKLAPEMSGFVDEYFHRFQAAGLRVGVCIRPQQLILDPDGKARQVGVADAVQILSDKIAYASRRWGATLFYIDSNGLPGLPLDARVMEQIAAAHPDVLLIPEHANLLYYAYTAPYRELRGGTSGTNAMVRAVYPDAFTVVNTADGGVVPHLNDLKAAVGHGDVMMFRGWFNDPDHAALKEILRAMR